jgi:hypothetical protein
MSACPKQEIFRNSNSVNNYLYYARDICKAEDECQLLKNKAKALLNF